MQQIVQESEASKAVKSILCEYIREYNSRLARWRPNRKPTPPTLMAPEMMASYGRLLSEWQEREYHNQEAEKAAKEATSAYKKHLNKHFPELANVEFIVAVQGRAYQAHFNNERLNAIEITDPRELIGKLLAEVKNSNDLTTH